MKPAGPRDSPWFVLAGYARSISVRVLQKDYNEIIKSYVPEQWDHAYYFLFVSFIAAATSMEKHFGPSRPIEFSSTTSFLSRNRSSSELLEMTEQFFRGRRLTEYA